MSVDEAVRWVLSVDRRLLVMKETHENEVIRTSELAEKTGRSVQNISRAIHEMEEKGLIECITPEKGTWKRYFLTFEGKKVLESIQNDQTIN